MKLQDLKKHLKASIPMTNEELIAEANRRYPIGTRYKTAYTEDDPQILVATTEAEWHKEYYSIKVGYGLVYYHGTWAEIVDAVSEPIPLLFN